MAEQTPTTARHSNKRVLIALALLGLIIIASLGGWAYLRLSGHDTTGLEGTWHWEKSPAHSYEFLPSGEFASWSGPKNWWNKIGWNASWRRDGNQLTIQTDGNWNFEGQIEGNKIRGKMLMRDQTGAAVKTDEMVLQKE